MAKIWEEHPEDRKDREEAEAYGKEFAESFATIKRDRLVKLIEIYPDDLAEHLLSELRDEFWSREWQRGEIRSFQP